VRRRVVTCAAALLLLAPTSARAQTDLLIVPFIGMKFAGSTSIALGEPTVGEKKVTFGVSSMLLGDNFLGIEADIEQTPQFFGPGVQRTVTSSGVTTLTGNVVIAVPKVITQESLRPYVVAGVGLMHARVSTQIGLLDTKSNLLGLDIGGGVIGFVSPRAGARFELRHFKNLTDDASGAVTIGGTKLSFWRVTVGVVLRY
jgi:opacity protein-like surface antigen